jgi:PAS domain S-box-containing protein
VAVDNARLYRAAQESEERLSGIIGSAMDAIVTVDGDGRILVFNGAAERMFRCAAKDALGTRATRFFPEALAGEEGASPAPPVVPAAPRVITARRDDGTEFAAEATVSRAEAGGQPLYTAIVRDLADRQRAEAAERALKEQEGRQRLFLREILSSVTEGKLRLCDTAADLPAPLPEASPAIGLTRETMRGLRAAAAEVAAAEGLPEQRTQDLLTAVGEAGMNAVRHGGGGTGRVRAMDGRVQVWVEDRGKGIDLDRLPRAVAERGYTTGGGFGHGFYLMLQTCDAVYLLTGPDGTTVVLEQGREAPAPAWLLGHNAATDW